MYTTKTSNKDTRRLTDIYTALQKGHDCFIAKINKSLKNLLNVSNKF